MSSGSWPETNMSLGVLQKHAVKGVLNELTNRVNKLRD